MSGFQFIIIVSFLFISFSTNAQKDSLIEKFKKEKHYINCVYNPSLKYPAYKLESQDCIIVNGCSDTLHPYYDRFKDGISIVCYKGIVKVKIIKGTYTEEVKLKFEKLPKPEISVLTKKKEFYDRDSLKFRKDSTVNHVSIWIGPEDINSISVSPYSFRYNIPEMSIVYYDEAGDIIKEENFINFFPHYKDFSNYKEGKRLAKMVVKIKYVERLTMNNKREKLRMDFEEEVYL